jgi:hypothetical protein
LVAFSAADQALSRSHQFFKISFTGSFVITIFVAFGFLLWHNYIKPRTADRPARGWPPEGRIVMTPRAPNYYPISVSLIMEFTYALQVADPRPPGGCPPSGRIWCFQLLLISNVISEWIVIRRRLWGHNDMLFRRPTPGWSISP